MCFQWLRRIYHCLRGRRARRNRGYSNEISSHHRGCYGSSGGLSSIQGHGSFFCGGEGSVIYSRGASPCQPMPTSSTYNVAGGYRCGSDGSVVITSGDNRGTSGWDISGGTVPVYGSRGKIGCSSEDSGQNIIISSGDGGGSICHSGKLGIAAGGGSGYGYDASPREKALTGGVSGGSGCHSGGLGYGIRGCSGPELSSGGDGFSQDMQQKCPVVIPNIEDHQCKQSSQWPPSQKK
ncbi:keratin, type II cytoskeletal 2 epidermal-like [Tyto alba]|uniref:keratin, type II cytoskeletal 2 epidermal-like n=1 Tax=Tyto alba TaxID=56313 RepID=UPI001C664603|nr:keratin, type II cytoskeletal 2 epidermal-like [Tyto alba]